jgi:hypothetical protein
MILRLLANASILALRAPIEVLLWLKRPKCNAHYRSSSIFEIYHTWSFKVMFSSPFTTPCLKTGKNIPSVTDFDVCVYTYFIISWACSTYLAVCTGLDVQLFLKPRICNQGEHTWLLLFLSHKLCRIWNYSPFISIYGSTAFCWTLSVFFCPIILYTVGMTPWTAYQPVARPQPTQTTSQTQNKQRHPWLEWDSNPWSQC